jgi:hypothetical protein
MSHAKTPGCAKNTVSLCSFAIFASLRETNLTHSDFSTPNQSLTFVPLQPGQYDRKP